MGNANGREDGANGGVDDLFVRSNGGKQVVRGAAAVAVRVRSSDSMANTPPQSPHWSRSPLVCAPQVPAAPLPRGAGHSFFNQNLPFVADEMGNVCNFLDVDDNVPENLDSVTEFEAPGSPNSSYGQAFPSEEDFAKEPVVVPSQLHVIVLSTDNQDGASSSKPEHVVLNHLFIEKGRASQSVVALGLTHSLSPNTLLLYSISHSKGNMYFSIASPCKELKVTFTLVC